METLPSTPAPFTTVATWARYDATVTEHGCMQAARDHAIELQAAGATSVDYFPSA